MDLSHNSELLSLFYLSLADPDQRRDFLLELCHQTQCEKAVVSFHSLTDKPPIVGYSNGISPEAQRDYIEHYAKTNPTAASRFSTVLREGSSYSINMIDERPEYIDSEYAQDFLLPNGMYYSAIGIGCSDGENFASLAVIRSKTDGRLDSGTEKIIQLLLPHLKYAFPLLTQTEALRASSASARLALDRFDTGVIAVNRYGHVVTINIAAEEILKKRDALMLSHGKLVAALPKESARLQSSISSAVSTGSGADIGIGDAMLIHRPSTSTALSVFVSPFRSTSLFVSDLPCALVFISDPAARPMKRSGLMRVLFKLTPAENRLVGLLIRGLELSAVAEQLHITRETARFMLKRIFEKTSTHRQSQLIRLISTLPGE